MVKMKKSQKALIALIVITTLIFTPTAIIAARAQRGYKAFGGEYLIPVLGAAAIYYIINIPMQIKLIKIKEDEKDE